VVKYLLQRLAIMIVMLAALSFIVFVTIELPPGDYADRRALSLRSAGIQFTQEDVVSRRKMWCRCATRSGWIGRGMSAT